MEPEQWTADFEDDMLLEFVSLTLVGAASDMELDIAEQMTEIS